MTKRRLSPSAAMSATFILSPSLTKAMVHESRKSTRVALKVGIEAQGISEPLTCEGETITVNLHGALISTAVGLRGGMRIRIHVYLTNKRADARVVYVDPDWPRHCGVAPALAQMKS